MVGELTGEPIENRIVRSKILESIAIINGLT